MHSKQIFVHFVQLLFLFIWAIISHDFSIHRFVFVCISHHHVAISAKLVQSVSYLKLLNNVLYLLFVILVFWCWVIVSHLNRPLFNGQRKSKCKPISRLTQPNPKNEISDTNAKHRKQLKQQKKNRTHKLTVQLRIGLDITD